jgi:hypothetical protein
MDESSKQLIGEVREPVPCAPGRVARMDDEYVRNGVAEIFMEVEPLSDQANHRVLAMLGGWSTVLFAAAWVWWHQQPQIPPAAAPSPSIERTLPGKPGAGSHVKR